MSQFYGRAVAARTQELYAKGRHVLALTYAAAGMGDPEECTWYDLALSVAYREAHIAEGWVSPGDAKTSESAEDGWEPGHSSCTSGEPCKVVPGMMHVPISEGYAAYLANRFRIDLLSDGPAHNGPYDAPRPGIDHTNHSHPATDQAARECEAAALAHKPSSGVTGPETPCPACGVPMGAPGCNPYTHVTENEHRPLPSGGYACQTWGCTEHQAVTPCEAGPGCIPCAEGAVSQQERARRRNADECVKLGHEPDACRNHEPWCMDSGTPNSECCGGNLLDGMGEGQ